MKYVKLTLFPTLFMATSVMAQSQPSSWVRLEVEHEIALARSAAPATVSENADIWVLNNESGRYEKKVEGSSGNACFVARGEPLSKEPICYDEEGTRTMLPIEFRRLELRIEGLSSQERESIIAAEIAAGKLSAPSRPALSYMMSSGQDLYSGERHVGPWKPHIMYYIPFLTDELVGLAAGPTTDIAIANPGTAVSFLMVVVPEFVDPVE